MRTQEGKREQKEPLGTKPRDSAIVDTGTCSPRVQRTHHYTTSPCLQKKKKKKKRKKATQEKF